MRKGEIASAKITRLSPGTKTVLERFVKALREEVFHAGVNFSGPSDSVFYAEQRHFRREADRWRARLINRLIRLEAGIKHSGRGRRKNGL